ncbi:MAG: hypothetical protein ACKOZU_01070 [Planctomycetaceae bacterium]
MDLVPGFQELLQGLSPGLTAPSFVSLCTLVPGWVFSGRGIVTRMIVAKHGGHYRTRPELGVEIFILPHKWTSSSNT